jgi:hypothetical protein
MCSENEQDKLNEFQAALARWREGNLFYFKLDLALVVALAALVSYFRMQSTDLMIAAHQYRYVQNILVAFIAYALVFQMLLMTTANIRDLSNKLEDARWSKVVSFVFEWAYILQTLAHLSLLFYVSSYIAGYTDGFVSHNKGG